MPLTDYSIAYGGIRIRIRDLRGENASPRMSFANTPIEKYVVANEVTADLDVAVETLEGDIPATGKLLFDSGAVWQLFEDDGAYRIECRVYGDLYKVAFLSSDLARATVRMAPDEGVPTYPLEYPLDEVILNLILARSGAAEIHACGLVDANGNGYLFAGNSRAGKTTTAGLWAGYASEILSDDRIVVRRENRAWWMYGTPWHGDAKICSTSRVQLHRVFLLNQAPVNARVNALEPLSPAAAVARLLSCTFPPFHDASAMNAVAGTLASIVADVPVAQFSFVNDRTAVDFILDTLKAAA
jgi:hypothetical protein